MKRIAVRRLHFPDGKILINQVIETADNGSQCYYPLTEEIPFTEWLGGDFYWNSKDK